MAVIGRPFFPAVAPSSILCTLGTHGPPALGPHNVGQVQTHRQTDRELGLLSQVCWLSPTGWSPLNGEALDNAALAKQSLHNSDDLGPVWFGLHIYDSVLHRVGN